MKLLADYSSGRDNNFNLLRFAAASLVIFSHAFWIAGEGASLPLIALGSPSDAGEIGVNIFFVISGFLIAGSFLQRGDLLVYLEARFLRIYPALWVALLFTVFIIGPLATELPLSKYFSSWDTYRYLAQNATLIRIDQTLPGLFLSHPEAEVVNNSLWTLPNELQFYLLVALLGVLGILSQRRIFNFIFVFALIFVFEWPHVFTLFGIDAISKLRLAGYFALGAFFYVNRDIIPLHWLGVVALMLLVVLLQATGHDRMALGFLGFAFAYAVLWFAFDPMVRIGAFNRIGDYSYGLYIYGFPIQQTLYAFQPGIGVAYLLAQSFALTLLMAVMSWHFLEKPALNLKGRTGFDKWFDDVLPWQHRSIGVERVNLSGPLLKVNRGLCEMLGYNRDELLRLSFRDITHPDDLVKEERLLAQLLNGEIRSYFIDKRYHRKSGEWIPVRVTSSRARSLRHGCSYRISIIEANGPDRASEDASAAPYPLFAAAEKAGRFVIRHAVQRLFAGNLREEREAVRRTLQESSTYRSAPEGGKMFGFGTLPVDESAVNEDKRKPHLT